MSLIYKKTKLLNVDHYYKQKHCIPFYGVLLCNFFRNMYIYISKPNEAEFKRNGQK